MSASFGAFSGDIPVPRDWPQNKRLPGAINVEFVDGHGEQVKLDRL